MSELSILGFKPSSQSPDTDIVHWAILVSPLMPAGAETQKTHKPRFFSRRSSIRSDNRHEDDSDTRLFDMHDHQLRQQIYPIPVEGSEEPSSTTTTAPPSEVTERPSISPSEDVNSPTSSSIQDTSASPAPATTSTTTTSTPTASATTTSITFTPTNETLPLCLRIKLGTHHSCPHKVVKKLSDLLYQTPTYGPEDDWLRAAVETTLEAGMLENPSSNSSSTNITVPVETYDAGRIVEFAREAAKEAVLSLQSGSNQEDAAQVTELDYPAHLARIAGVKALFGQHNHHSNHSLSSLRRSRQSSLSLRSPSPASSTASRAGTPRTQSRTRLAAAPATVEPIQVQAASDSEPQPQPQPQSRTSTPTIPSSSMIPNDPPPAYTPSNPPSPTYSVSAAEIPISTPAAQSLAPAQAPPQTTSTPRPDSTRQPQQHPQKKCTSSKLAAASSLLSSASSRSKRSFLGLRISPSPNACRQQAGGNNRPARHRWSYERQDDPYAGLM
ncbi:hypothetical protein HRR83_003313 [Exophiala dermatitidis]|uniref:Uncharacterized protein n=2 Tax=Exophiala dermatitidis TaxID=5970 RepID=H6BMU4_EXODN|nr:uncharacterized protein HMPREF1120_00339 [Exophiala dermatitidis NIH/UT8656]KAJ4514777.1 hypothetical protein HRR75_004141 [Exophiala dermatitidis]EHY52122.1 hypothetical protein HMPREF1120_00339 [Exophiala dermatitidis NIH/UT8656]KAJ4518234.1 hypothetical protein HRR74_004529 [Exophiala dermatitidis]KAJ4521132.1 hypothetical protein HRR73_003473 [Exophiala dermatitidis]KAJ4547720.1 hypothetical protein HRR76_000347 [Exophiala dermatitidis]